MTDSSLFSTYRQGENRVTASMLAVFERIDVRVVERLLAASSGELSLDFVTFANQIARANGTVPDAIISASFKYLFEVKTERNAIRTGQLQGHLAQLDGRHTHERLFAVTPDDARPQVIPDDPRIVWFSFLGLSQAIDALLNDPSELVFEHTRFLLRELQALFAADGLLGAQEDTVVVAARFAYPLYLSAEAYVCQARRTFRPTVTRIAFYAEGHIQAVVPRILYRQDEVPFTQAEVERLATSSENSQMHLSNVIKRLLESGERTDGDVQQVFLLSSPIDPTNTLMLPRSIRNTKIDQNGKPVAWLMGQRYTRASALETVAVQGGTTDDLDRAK